MGKALNCLRVRTEMTQGGLNKLNLQRKYFNNYCNNPYESTSLSGNLIMSVLEYSKGYLWVSSYKKTLNRSKKRLNGYKGESLYFDLVTRTLYLEFGEVIFKIYEDEKGFLWFGSTHSLFVYNLQNQHCAKLELSMKIRPIL